MHNTTTIENLEIQPLPTGKPVEVCRAIKHDGATLIVGTNGIVYSGRVKDRHFYEFGCSPWTDSLMRGLAKLKVITAKQRDEHIAKSKQRQAQANKRYALTLLQEKAKRYGFKLTREQIRALK